MNRANFFSGQRVTSSDLNYIDTSKALASKQVLASVLGKFAHYYTGSIPADIRQTVADASLSLSTFRGVAGGYNSTQLAVTEISPEELSVAPGWGVTDNMDIIILGASVDALITTQTAQVSWVSTANSTMYVVAEYRESSGSVGTTLSGTTAYTRYTGDYRVLVTSVYPNGSSQIPLAQFTADSNGHITGGTLTDMRQFIRTNTTDTAVKLEGTPIFVGQSSVYDHIHATGSNAPSARNPHGNTLDDFGYVDYTATHRKDSHISGIVVYRDDFSTTSYVGTLGTGADDYISFGPPVGVALAVNGRIVTGSIPNPIYSSTAPVVGDYWVVVNENLQVSFVSTGSSGFNARFPQTLSQSVVLGYAYAVNPVGQTIGDFYDYRNFYTMSSSVIRADFMESGSIPTGSLPRTATLVDNLERIRYQIGKALSGSGSMWAGTNPLTAGSGSLADAYHYHTPFRNSNGLFQSNAGSTLTRALNTTYQNTTNNNLLVTVSVQLNLDVSTTQMYEELLISTGSVLNVGFVGNTIGIVGSGKNTATTSVHAGTMTGVVPKNSYYRVSGSMSGTGGSVSLLSWAESF